MSLALSPPIDRPCEVCRAAQNSLLPEPTPFPEIERAASSGCRLCELRVAGILKVMGWEKKKDVSPDQIWVEFYNSVIRLWVTGGLPRESPALAFTDVFNGCNIQLHTLDQHTPSALPIVGIGRDMSQPRETTYHILLQDWFSRCQRDHLACQLEVLGPLPSRVLDVGAEGSQFVYLYVTNGNSGSYTALSHCWGNSKPLLSLKENFELMQRGLPYSSLPRTFQDAVSVTRTLGIKYLWIDSLCIIQDDPYDWQVESGNMASIYGHATLVIGATKASGCHEGFLQRGQQRISKSQEIGKVKNENGSTSIIHARFKSTFFGCHGFFCNVGDQPYTSMNNPLFKRAWTVQE